MLRSYRKKAGLTQTELAYKLGYTSPQFISNIERQLAGLPPAKFTKVSALLKIPMATLTKSNMLWAETKMRRAIK